MSQRKIRQSSEEAMAAREAMENALPENVTPITLPDPEWDDAPAPEEPSPEVTDEDIENFMAEQGQDEVQEGPDKEAEAPVEDEAARRKREEYNRMKECEVAAQVECPCCGAQIITTSGESAIDLCTCPGAKVLRQSGEMHEKIDMLFGPGSAKRYGFPMEHSDSERNIMKLIGSYVAQRKIKAVTITLENNDKAVILVKKDATVVRHTKATKAEAEV